MEQPTRQFLGFNFGVLCCALVWAFSTAQPTRYGQTAAARAVDAPTAGVECADTGGAPLARTELFFGLARAGGPAVTAEEFQQFVDQEITPRFPNGLTLLGGSGQFRSANGDTVKENSKVLILLYAGNGNASKKIEAIRAAYTRVFAQESVLRVDGYACAS